jgi:lysyl endopeptidase
MDFHMPSSFLRYALLGTLVMATAATAQLSVPPAVSRATLATKAEVEPALMLPSGAAARSILLSTPTKAEHDGLTPKSSARPGKDGAVPKRRSLIIGFARQVPVAEGLFRLSDLAWVQMAGGEQVVHIDLTSSSAAAIRIGLVLNNVPATLALRFKGSASEQVFGPYPADVARDSIYWSPALEGETGTIELTLPAGADPDGGTVSLPMISHLVVSGNALRQDDPLGQIGTAGACEVDVACISATLKAQSATAINAVARVMLTDQGQTALCSGTLINDSINSSTPYFFTANHCIDDDDDDVGASKDHPAIAAASINTYWFFQTSVCGQDTAANVNFVVVAGGAKLLGRSTDFDWNLLQLNNPPPAGATFAAWNATPLSATGVAANGIHHPEGDLKKFSQGATQGFQTFDDGSSYVTMQWTQGVTEAGSSGSGLFTFNSSQNYYELRGALFGGNSSCSAPSETDIYSRMDVALPLLKQYLTPTAPNPAKETLVVEFYNSSLDDYFITAVASEIQILDNGSLPGWKRTGLTFLAYSDPAAAPVAVSPVCRFYVLPLAGDSHFYSADPNECTQTATKFAGTWVEEIAALFYIQLPNQQTGACPANTRPIFRFLNNVNGLHHRFTAEVDVRDSITDDGGWTQEGYGNPPAQTVMCSPTS